MTGMDLKLSYCTLRVHDRYKASRNARPYPEEDDTPTKL